MADVGKVKTQVLTRKEEPENDIRALRTVYKFVNFFGAVLGVKCCYDWKPNLRFCISIAYIVYAWSQAFYSQFLYTTGGELKKNLQVFAIYGATISV